MRQWFGGGGEGARPLTPSPNPTPNPLREIQAGEGGAAFPGYL